MSRIELGAYRAPILRIFLGLTVGLWGYEKLTLEKLAGAYSMDYGPFMVLDVTTFLDITGWLQLAIGALLIVGLLTRVNAAVLALMGVVTIVVPGAIVMQDVPHFAYAFALTGGALALCIEGGGVRSLDRLLTVVRVAGAPSASTAGTSGAG